MRPRFIHLGVNFGANIPGTVAVDAHLNIVAPDWLRYSNTTWLIWTDLPMETLVERMKPAFIEGDQYLFAGIDTTHGMQGMFTQFVWDWINRPRDGGWVPPQPRPLPRLTGRPALEQIPPLRDWQKKS